MKSIIWALMFLFLFVAPSAGQSEDIKDFCNNLIGASYWLKIGVVEVHFGYRGVDATNITPDGKPSYRARIRMRQTQSQIAEDFAEEARILLATQDKLGMSAVRVVDRGTKVKIKKVSAKKDEIKVELEKVAGAKHAVHFKFEKGYALADFQQNFKGVFAESESELQGTEKTVKIELGMSIEDVISLKGKPKTQVDLGAKTILTYDDLKLIFKDGKLADVQ